MKLKKLISIVIAGTMVIMNSSVVLADEIVIFEDDTVMSDDSNIVVVDNGDESFINTDEVELIVDSDISEELEELEACEIGDNSIDADEITASSYKSKVHDSKLKVTSRGEITGKCGDKLTFRMYYYGDKLCLDIKGSGPMYDYAGPECVPWLPIMNEEGYPGTINISDSVTRIGDYAFYKTSEYRIDHLPKKLKSIGKYSFCYAGASNAGNKAIDIPKSVTTIDDYAFKNFNYYIKLNEGLKVIGDYAFDSAKFDKTIVIPNTVKSIGDGAFVTCYNIETIKLGSSLETIGDEAFSFVYANTVKGGKKVKRVGKNAFSVTADKIEFITSDLSKSSLEYLGDTAFAWTSGKKIKFPNTLKILGYLNSDNTCTVYIPSSCQRIPGRISGKVVVSGEKFKSIVDDTIIKDYEDNFYAGYRGDFDRYKLGDNVYWKPVIGKDGTENAIVYGKGAMYDFSSDGFSSMASTITGSEVTVEKGITYIGAYSLRCARKVKLPSGLKEIGDHAFEQGSLKAISIPTSVTRIGDYAFYRNDITELKIPGNVVSIGKYAFESNRIKKLTLNNGIKEIGEGCFAYNENLKTVTVPGSVERITENAFGYPQKVVIKNGVKAIGERAFRNTKKLSITFADSIEYIGEDAFAHVKFTNTIKLPKKLISMSTGAFSSASGPKIKLENAKSLKLLTNSFMDSTLLPSTVKLPDSMILQIGGLQYAKGVKKLSYKGKFINARYGSEANPLEVASLLYRKK